MRILFCLLYFSVATAALANSRAKITLKVVDTDLLPIEDAQVMVVFNKPRGNNWNIDPVSFTGNTDSNGCFVAEGKGLPFLFLNAEKDGYYKASKKVSFKEKNKLLNRWEPWNSLVELTLKERLNQEALYHYNRTKFYSIPAYDTDVGYDFEQADWVVPHGKGETADVILHIKRRFVAWNDYDVDMTISFSNDGDGIQKFVFDQNDTSSFKWPYLAPTKGYNSEITFEKHYSKDGSQSNYDDETDKYIFRVRTAKDDEGNIKSACYGKLSRIRLSWGQELNWEYWFNPDSKSRNLEDDPKKNKELAK